MNKDIKSVYVVKRGKLFFVRAGIFGSKDVFTAYKSQAYYFATKGGAQTMANSISGARVHKTYIRRTWLNP